MQKHHEANLKAMNKALEQHCSNLLTKIQDPNAQVNMNMAGCSQTISKLFDESNSRQIRARFAYTIQKQIRKFLKIFLFNRLTKLVQSKNTINKLVFVDEICDLWQNYQRFIYGMKFVLHRTTNTYQDFHRNSNTHQSDLNNEKKKDGIDQLYKNEVSPLPVMAVNQLKQFLTINKFIEHLEGKFIQFFCIFVRNQRDGENIPRQKVNQVLEFFESSYLDYDCDIERVNEKMKIVKRAKASAPANRKSTASTYFEAKFVKNLLDDCEVYYKLWVDQKAMNMNAAEQLKQMINFLQQEEDRANFYIHDPKNEKKYIELVNLNLIQYRYQQRTCKPSGLKYFLTHFQIDKADMVEEINNFWKVNKRVYMKQDKKNIILGIYQNYLIEQANQTSKLTDKPQQFIQSCVKLNNKNQQILRMLERTLDIDRIRKQILQNLLTMKYKPAIKDYFGAKHWAGVLNRNLKLKYAKSVKYDKDQVAMMDLFKLIKLSSTAIKQHCKCMCSRLIDQVDMGLGQQYNNAIQLETKILQQIKKETSENDIKPIQNCLKDVKNSCEERMKQKAQPKLAKFSFFNQLLKKSGSHWVDTPVFDIQAPAVLRPCIEALRELFQNSNFVFEYQNGTSMFTGTFGKETLKFQFKNIYMIILLLLDQKPNKKMFYNDLLKAIKPIGSEKTTNEFVKYLIQLINFGLVKTNKPITPAQINNLWAWQPSDYLQINQEFPPAEKKNQPKAPIYKTAQLLPLPQFIRKSMNIKLSTIEEQEKNMEKDRRNRVESRTVKLLKFSQTKDGGKGTITFQQILSDLVKNNRQDNVSATYLKQVMQHLLNTGYCQREEKRNVFRYTT